MVCCSRTDIGVQPTIYFLKVEAKADVTQCPVWHGNDKAVCSCGHKIVLVIIIEPYYISLL